jgi:hypothetical protein
VFSIGSAAGNRKQKVEVKFLYIQEDWQDVLEVHVVVFQVV